MARTAAHGTLAADVVATVILTQEARTVEVLNRDGAAEIYFTADGSTPAVGGDDCFVLPAAIGSLEVTARGARDDQTVVKLVSSGTPTYSVQAA